MVEADDAQGELRAVEVVDLACQAEVAVEVELDHAGSDPEAVEAVLGYAEGDHGAVEVELDHADGAPGVVVAAASVEPAAACAPFVVDLGAERFSVAVVSHDQPGFVVVGNCGLGAWVGLSGPFQLSL